MTKFDTHIHRQQALIDSIHECTRILMGQKCWKSISDFYIYGGGDEENPNRWFATVTAPLTNPWCYSNPWWIVTAGEYLWPLLYLYPPDRGRRSFSFIVRVDTLEVLHLEHLDESWVDVSNSTALLHSMHPSTLRRFRCNCASSGNLWSLTAMVPVYGVENFLLR
jgi:hypothetical protein